MTQKTAQKNAEIIQKFSDDPAFKSQMTSDTVLALKSLGIEVKEGVQVKVVEDTDTIRHLVIPVKPSNLDDSELKGVAGGFRGDDSRA